MAFDKDKIKNNYSTDENEVVYEFVDGKDSKRTVYHKNGEVDSIDYAYH
jgi:hypothetical protein